MRFRGAGTDSGPAKEVGNVLGGDGVEEFGRGRDPEVDDVAEEATRTTEAFSDVIGLVEVGIHDEALPANRGSGLFKVDTHDEKDAIFDLFSESCEALCVFEAGFGVVDRARACDHEEAVIFAKNGGIDLFPSRCDEITLAGGWRDLSDKFAGTGEWLCRNDVEVGGLRRHSCKLVERFLEQLMGERHGEVGV